MTKKTHGPARGQAAALSKSNQTTTAMTAKINPNTCLIEHANGGITMSARRTHVCLNAAWEVETLAHLLAGLPDRDGVTLAMRGIAARLIQLSTALSDGLSNAVEPTLSLECTTYVKMRGEIEGGNHD